MTDDEAFVRGLVDSPGDDLPRLIYADWLQDHNDPRADYLRAELTWAEPWKEGQPPSICARLQAMAARLDPLWVARVSRTPIGVCCDHIPFEDRGNALDAADIDRFERRHDIMLPTAYRALLLNVNGGIPDACRFGFGGHGYDGEAPLDLRWFRSLDPSHQTDCLRAPVEVLAHKTKHQTIRKYLVIADAETDRDDNTVLLGLSGPEAGFVFDRYRTRGRSFDPDELNFLCDSFIDFMSMLAPIDPSDLLFYFDSPDGL
ncbi:TIGR02996 domain-containing protein [Limnoglobus roseus]|uniref:TIGR02996 domain-containing protein n=1 Tax=Limnoglobus roseus TaxID=2598579 RepID=A0A5C1A725_9BACT|nr:TIGR02996 domain-containing protein [Limnoglobus roseus]QEL13806.1 TIGR02996 domain-containing protein [Limnoglobus roseus]